ncbi:uncharacterized protein [Diabrotica undecimpunctata]|uniref:uncharacterized protein n=1 Tax=Diabrotica undecimpunctata TaxID=50387 RepID=UPI003B631EE4
MSRGLSEYQMKRPLSVKELQAILEDDSDLEEADEIDAVYIPPLVNVLTDEEDLDDNLLIEEEALTDIAGTFEIYTRSREEAKTPTESILEPSTTRGKKRKVNSERKCKPTQYTPDWSKSSENYSSSPKDNEFNKKEEIKLRLAGKTPFEIFSLFFEDIVFQKILEFSLTYARDNNRHNFKLSPAQLQKFFGILILTGYHTLLACDMYWSRDPDKGVELVKHKKKSSCLRQ